MEKNAVGAFGYDDYLKAVFQSKILAILYNLSCKLGSCKNRRNEKKGEKKKKREEGKYICKEENTHGYDEASPRMISSYQHRNLIQQWMKT